MLDLTKHGFKVVARAPQVEDHEVTDHDVAVFVFLLQDNGDASSKAWTKPFEAIDTSKAEELFPFMIAHDHGCVIMLRKGFHTIYVYHPSFKHVPKDRNLDETVVQIAKALKKEGRVLLHLRGLIKENADLSHWDGEPKVLA